MTGRTFRFRLHSSHRLPERSTSNLVVEFLAESGLWEPQQLSFSLPGFRIYLISLLLCQHVYLVANAQEHNIPLHQVDADFVVTTSSDWIVAAVEGDFRIRLDADATPEERQLASTEAIAFMQERMKLCPISRNLPESVAKHIGLSVSDT
jgi:hypothetical protein